MKNLKDMQREALAKKADQASFKYFLAERPVYMAHSRRSVAAMAQVARDNGWS